MSTRLAYGSNQSVTITDLDRYELVNEEASLMTVINTKVAKNINPPFTKTCSERNYIFQIFGIELVSSARFVDCWGAML